MTLTEFNQNVSRATRIAREEDLYITERGVEAFRLTALPQPDSLIEKLKRKGIIRPARPMSERTDLPTMDISREEARKFVAEFEASRGDLYGS